MWQRSFETILAFAFLCGLIRSALICNFNLSISEEVDDEKVPSAVGLHMLFKALAVMTFAPLIGKNLTKYNEVDKQKKKKLLLF